MKKAKLVQVTFTTRVIVDENTEGEFDYDKMCSDATHNLIEKLINEELVEHIETHFDDVDMPFTIDDLDEATQSRLCDNKTIAEIEDMDDDVVRYEALRRLFSRNLLNCGPLDPLLPIDTDSELREQHPDLIPTLTRIEQDITEGIIEFTIDGTIIEFDDIEANDLMYIAKNVGMN